MQQNCSQEHQGVGAIQGRCSVEVCRCGNRTTSFVWLSQNKCPTNKGQPEHVWGRAGGRVIPFCGARIDFYPGWEKAEFLTNFCGHRQWVWIAIEVCKTQSNALPHSEWSCFFLLFLRSLQVMQSEHFTGQCFCPSVSHRLYDSVRKYSYLMKQKIGNSSIWKLKDAFPGLSNIMWDFIFPSQLNVCISGMVDKK